MGGIVRRSEKFGRWFNYQEKISLSPFFKFYLVLLKMLSVTAATVHRTMCPTTPKNTTPERKARPWTCDFNAISKRRRSGGSRKNLSLRLMDPVELNVEVSRHPATFDDLKTPKTKKSSNLSTNSTHLSPKSTARATRSPSHQRPCPNRVYREASFKAKLHTSDDKPEDSAKSSEDDRIGGRSLKSSVKNKNDDEMETKSPLGSTVDEREKSFVSSSPVPGAGEKRKRGFESRMSVALKILKSDDNDINYSKCRPVVDSGIFEEPKEESKIDPVDREMEGIFPEVPHVYVQESWDTTGNWDSQVQNWDEPPQENWDNPPHECWDNPVQENWDNWDDVNPAMHAEDPLAGCEHVEMPHYMTGFPNPPGENRCWLNATLQTIFALPLIDRLGKLNLEKCSMLTQTLVATQVFWMEGAAKKQITYQTVARLKAQLEVLDESYSSQRQQDVSEFLMILLNYVKTDCEKLLKNVGAEGEAENVPDNLQTPKNMLRSPPTPTKRPPLTQISPFKRRISFNDSTDESSPLSQKSCDDSPDSAKADQSPKNPIDEFFLLPMMEHCICQNCQKHRQRKVDELMLYVDPPENEADSVELADAINKTFESSTRSVTCSRCKASDHSVYMRFRGSPSVLIVQINRYGKTSDGLVAKINSAVHIPEALDIHTNELVSEKERFVPVCAIAHVGGAMDCGHYTSYVKHDDQWFHYNDMSVTPMSAAEALAAAQTTAYLVFFVNTSLLPRSTILTEDSTEEASR